MKTLLKISSLGFISLMIISLLGCSNLTVGRKSSVVDYLYPSDSKKIIDPSIPVLRLPIKLGIAFVPEQVDQRRGHNMWARDPDLPTGLTEVKKMQILARVSSYFKKYSFVGEIQEIPSSYLTPSGSFTNLEQIKTMYGIDVIALVSYDQVQFTDAGLLSISYWTIVGAYIVSGDKNDTNTLMDTVVYDIASKKMLFRAPGTSIVKGRSTPVNQSEELRIDSAKGFDLAAQAMIENLDVQLASFREKAKRNPEQVNIEKSQNYSGGGGVDIFLLIGLVLILRLFFPATKLLNKDLR